MESISNVAFTDSKQAVLALLYQYSWAYDTNDMALLGSVFSNSGSTGGVVAGTSIGWGQWRGRRQIVDELAAIRCSQPDRRRHVITSPVFEFVDRERARLRVYLSLFSYANGKPPHLVTTGEYVMKASVHDGGWLIDSLNEVLASPF
ncbi:nuclear transport factor 2 family protein [Paraburkholderia sp. BL25I1N1]|uniref:nuclear transport factor 2 family protein n=1 Tax=Paraburkholderia sp. BL25I1N1 TaxID=1938804 RepID=UPI000D0812A3|nr:nuclear transport factor 2 family protein [Paraburkholderia sp. BL25I1N1]PRX92069.1 SnoaL-like protein [Paraburkholderia sp. BL25I1N1]